MYDKSTASTLLDTSEHYSILATTAFHIKGMRDHAFDSSHLIRWFAGCVINYTPISTSTRVWHVKGACRGPTPQPGLEPRTFNVIDERSTTVPTAACLINGIGLKQLLQLQSTQALDYPSRSRTVGLQVRWRIKWLVVLWHLRSCFKSNRQSSWQKGLSGS